jgi:Leucine-rich repeat (LRR) protein
MVQLDNTPQSTRPKPLAFTIDTHHLFYIFIRLEALGYRVGSLDLTVNPSRPINYIDVSYSGDTSDSISLSSIRTSLSAVSRLSLGVSIWARPEPPSVDQELKYIFSSFTKIPALSLRAPGPKKIIEMAADPPNENALPLDSFRNLQSLECIDIDPRTLLGWDRLSESLWSLTMKRSGLDDVSDLFINAVLDDAARRRIIPSLDPPILSRQSSFHSTRLPDSVAENVEETVVTPTSDDPPRLPSPTESSVSPQLPPSKWAFLRHLSLADNALTFIPTESLPYLSSLTHLDLSSNLLVSIPPGLSSLYNLVSLNLSDNMIDSVVGIYKKLGQVLALNLSRNRLDSLCGLERLMALERVDVRHNQLEESGEVGRLSSLPNITEVWVEGNAFTEIEGEYRVKCFDFFWKEGKSILLDGTPAGFYERRSLTSPPPEQMNSTRPMSKAYSPPVVPVGGAATATTAPTVAPAPSSGASSSSSPVFSPAPSFHQPSPLLPATSAKPRKKRAKRIVHLEADPATANAAGTWITVSEEASEYIGSAASATRSPRVAPASLFEAPPLASPEDDTTPKSSTVPPHVVLPQPPKHRRSQTEFAPALESDGPPSPVLLRSSPDRTMSVRVSARRSAARRARAAASVFEAPGKMEEGSGEGIKEADAFRARVEALRSEMGDGWLKVFSQSHAGGSG